MQRHLLPRLLPQELMLIQYNTILRALLFDARVQCGVSCKNNYFINLYVKFGTITHKRDSKKIKYILGPFYQSLDF